MHKAILFAFLAVSLFAQNPGTGTWVGISAHGAPFMIHGYDKATYVDSLNAVCVWGGYKQPQSSEPNQAIGCYSYRENRWQILTVGAQWHTERLPGAGHSNGVFTYMPDYDSILYYVDGSGSNVAERFLAHLWWFDVGGLAGRDRTLSGSLARPWLGASTPDGNAAYDPAQNKMLFFPAYNASGTMMGQVYNPATNSFTAASTTNQPSSAANFAMEYYNGKLWSFIGNNLYTYDVALDQWALISPASCTGADCQAGNKPPTRLAAGFACSATDNVCLMAGGTTSFGGTAKTDTWVYDPSANSWTQLSPAATYGNNGTNTTFDRLRYDPVSNVFILLSMGAGTPYADGTWTFQTVKPFVLAYSAALDYGRTAKVYQPASGSLNRVAAQGSYNSRLGTQSWAFSPALAVNGTTMAAGWMETFTYFDTSNCGAQPHPYLQTTPNTGTWTTLPTGTMTAACQDIDPDSTNNTFGSKLTAAYVDGTLWEAHEKWNLSTITSRAYASSWNGSQWDGGAVGCFTAACSATNRQYPAQIIASGTTPTLAVIEADHTQFMTPFYLYVAQWNGSSWSRVGTGKLNHSASAASRVLGASIGADGSGNILACWNEEVSNTGDRKPVVTNAQVFCKYWDGASWSAIITGATFNQTAGSWAGKPSVIRNGSLWYIAWTERAVSGTPRLYVASWNGSTVTVLGGAAISLDTSTGWAASPSLAGDGTNLYVAWDEQENSAEKARLYVKKWDGAAWSQLGSALNAGSAGSATDAQMAVVSGRPTVLWSELNLGSLQQTYIKQWNGTAWGAVGAPDAANVSVANTIQEVLYAGGSTGIARADEPFNVSVPLPDGTGITSAGAFGLTGATAGQFRVLGNWASGDVKWLNAKGVVAGLNAGSTATVTLAGGAGAFGGSHLADDNGTTITVDTGAATFVVKKANFNVLDAATVGSTTLVAPGTSTGLVVMGPDPAAAFPGNVTCSPTAGGTACTTAYTSANDAGSTCAIEENGPAAAVVKCDGDLEDGAAHVYMRHTTRLYFYKGKSQVRVRPALRNADHGLGATFASAYKGHQGFELRLTANLSGTLDYTIANHTATPTTGSLSGSDYAYIYQAESTMMKNANWCTSGSWGTCVAFTSLNGYAIIEDGAAVQTGTSSQWPAGWADIRDSGGAGIEVGQYLFAAYGNKSLEFRSGGTDVRVGLWASQNNTTSTSTLTPNKPYYQPWPAHSEHDVYLNFHASAPASLANDFLKQQHPLFGRAPASQYNASGVFLQPILTAAEEDSYYSGVVASASPSVTAPTFQDLGTADFSNFPLHIWRFFAWETGGITNQMDFRWSWTQNWLTRGMGGRLMAAEAFIKMMRETSWPRSDGFNWRDFPNEVQYLAFPKAQIGGATAATNINLGMQNFVGAGMEHGHTYAIYDYYFVTGDEATRDAITDVLDAFLVTNSTNNLITNGTLWNQRAVGIVLQNLARLHRYLIAVGDTTDAAAALSRGQTVYDLQLKPELCISGHPVGCTVSYPNPGPSANDDRGISRVRGVPFPYQQTLSYPSCPGGDQRAASSFQDGILLLGMNEFRREYGPGWSDYTLALDLEYGVAKWAEKEMLVYNGTGIRSGEGFRYYQLIAQQNVGGSCGVVTEFPVQNPNAFWHIFRVIGAVEGQTSTWKDAFEHTVQNVIAGGASIRDELYGYTIGAVIDLVLRPPAETLQAVTITGFTDNGGGSYTLQWTKPAGTTSQRVKWGGKQIVDWIGYNPAAGAFTGDPANTMNWFAATEATGSPACAGAACSLTMATGQAGLAAGNFSVKAYAPEPVAVPRIRGRATLTGAGTLR